jgi:hypothetical protein
MARPVTSLRIRLKARPLDLLTPVIAGQAAKRSRLVRPNAWTLSVDVRTSQALHQFRHGHLADRTRYSRVG